LMTDGYGQRGFKRLWGGNSVKARFGTGGGNKGQRMDGVIIAKEKAKLKKWHPLRSHWEAYVTDDEGEEAFGKLEKGHEVEVLVKPASGSDLEATWQMQLSEKAKATIDAEELDPNLKGLKWVGAVVTQVADGEAEITPAEGKPLKLVVGQGWLRRAEDARELLTEEELSIINRCRSRRETEVLFQYALNLKTVSARSHALLNLSRMGRLDLSDRLIQELGAEKFASIAVRAHAHEYAHVGNVEGGMRMTSFFDDASSALLMIEVLALGLTSAILREFDLFTKRTGEKQGRDRFWVEVDRNPRIREVVHQVKATLPAFAIFGDAVRAEIATNKRLREGFSAAFDELLMSCGRAGAVQLSFRILEWIEDLRIPKTFNTYKAIGQNTVRRVNLLGKVWDLPLCPQDQVAPEVVFAGRSNVGKSSLVNMMLGRKSLAPTSAKPGKTKTMDFYDVNNGHPALPRFRLVDVPGLGFARVSNELRERWVALIGGYFVQRKSLKLCFHLLDTSVCDLMPADRELWRLLAQAQRDPNEFELCIALTKADDTDEKQIARFADVVREALRKEGSELAMRATIFACSSKSMLGKDTLWRKVWTAIGGKAKLEGNLGEGPETRQRKEEFVSAGEKPGARKAPPTPERLMNSLGLK